MKSYFSQFGDVSRLRLSRNKTVSDDVSCIIKHCTKYVTQTGRSKHYAFLEFESSSVAQIVAETMDNYLLMGHILTCKVIPKDEVHAELWVGANRKWRPVPMSRVARVQHNKVCHSHFTLARYSSLFTCSRARRRSKRRRRKG